MISLDQVIDDAAGKDMDSRYKNRPGWTTIHGLKIRGCR